MSSNPYSQNAVIPVKGFFQVGDEGERKLINANRVTLIQEDDEDSTTIFYADTNGDSEEYVEVEEAYNSVLTKFAQARSEV